MGGRKGGEDGMGGLMVERIDAQSLRRDASHKNKNLKIYINCIYTIYIYIRICYHVIRTLLFIYINNKYILMMHAILSSS